MFKSKKNQKAYKEMIQDLVKSTIDHIVEYVEMSDYGITEDFPINGVIDDVVKKLS